MLTDNINGLLKLLLIYILAAAENNAISMGNLVNEELTVVSGIHLALLGMYHCNTAFNYHVIIADLGNSNLYIRQLAYTRWLNDNPVRIICFHNLL